MNNIKAVPAEQEPGETGMSTGLINIDSEWLDDAKTNARGPSQQGIERSLGAIASLNFESEKSTYVLEGRFGYELLPDGKSLVIREYSGIGMPIDGLDRGEIHYANRGEWKGELDASKRFEIVGELLWDDTFNSQAVLQVVLKGSLVKDGRIAYLNTRISGIVASGDVAQTRVLVDVPALM
jgi:hypothetical protein